MTVLVTCVVQVEVMSENKMRITYNSGRQVIESNITVWERNGRTLAPGGVLSGRGDRPGHRG